MNFVKRSHLVLGIALCAVVGIMANVYAHNRSYGLESTTIQDPTSLDRRISLLEQRFYSLETSINRLQQYVVSQSSSVSQSRIRDNEINQMSQDVQSLSLRINEIECALLKLDERTAARKTDPARGGDPCRLNSTSPVRLSNRP